MSDDDAEEEEVRFHGLDAPLVNVRDAAEETMLIWCLQQPLSGTHNAYVQQAAVKHRISAAGHDLLIHQAPSSLGKPGVTGAVLWDSAVVLAKFLENASDTGLLQLKGKKVVELGAGCGLLGCVAALLGANVILTDLPDRLRLLQKNVHENVTCFNARGTACVQELTWGNAPDASLIDPRPDYVIASDVVYDEEPICDLLETLKVLCSRDTLVFVAGELRNAAVVEYFIDKALATFSVGRLEQDRWHSSYRSQKVVIYVMKLCHEM